MHYDFCLVLTIINNNYFAAKFNLHGYPVKCLFIIFFRIPLPGDEITQFQLQNHRTARTLTWSTHKTVKIIGTQQRLRGKTDSIAVENSG